MPATQASIATAHRGCEARRSSSFSRLNFTWNASDPSGPRAVQLKATFRQIDPDHGNLFHGCLLLRRGVHVTATLAQFDAVAWGRPFHRLRRAAKRICKEYTQHRPSHAGLTQVWYEAELPGRRAMPEGRMSSPVRTGYRERSPEAVPPSAPAFSPGRWRGPLGTLRPPAAHGLGRLPWMKENIDGG